MYPQFFSKVRSLVLLTGLILVFTTACTRKSQEDGTKVRMNFSSTFSKAQSLAGIAIPTGYYPGHLVANVQFDGQTALYHWDCKEMENDGDPALCAFPDFIDFNGRTFPNGSNRIVQVLIVFSNENDQLLFAYDDEIGVAFSGGDVYVDIGDNWSLEGGGKMARVSGRHGLAKSGKVEGFYQPKRTGRPRMKLFDEYIFNGWFSLMFFEGVKLSYYHTGVAVGGTETALFVEKSLESLEAEMTSTKAAIQINIPSFYKVFEENPPNYRSDRDGGENVVIGFFDSTGKPQANGTTFSLAKPTAAVSVSYVFRNILNGTLLDPIGNDGQFVNPSTGNSGGLLSEWSPSHELNFVMGTDPNLPNSFIQSHGIGATNATACAGVSDSDLVTPKCIMIRPEFVREHKVVPFEGPFEAIVGTHGPETIANTSQTSVEWRFLPGVAGVAVHGLAFFIVNSSDEFHDRAPCHEMALKAGISGTANLPFVDANVPPIYGHRLVNVSATSTSGSLDFGATTNLNGKKALACPWINVSGVKYFSTFAVDNHGFFNSG
ncbi:MAG: hypothetical protein KDD40_05715, partial [Bdellovibrionales bacterium]|nr:hypothetical protein [Bdellovibrionales bacterium]